MSFSSLYIKTLNIIILDSNFEDGNNNKEIQL